ncbi:zinc finger protein PLAG1-like [Onthophagus taurus]|uniref:zinc finger protein PLAG1-like n=1 Tax=Onthophagus taurus TaxID=166361 RepID=UPI000C2013B4|nr:zinc finger protein PLAG1-like [Onthophagus taurus]
MGTPGDKDNVCKVESNDEKESSEEKKEIEKVTMTVLTNLPEYSLTSFAVGLEQAHVEDFYPQIKYYETSSAESKVAEPSKTFPNLDEPGPSGLQTPKTRSSSKVNLKRKKVTSNPKKSFSCQHCQKTFQNPASLAKHQQIHGGSSPFKCEHCKKSFSSRFKLVRHVLIHSDRKQFSCTVCERTFHRKDHLKNHIKVHSPSKKIYVCDKTGCKKEYTSLLNYKKHLALHGAEEGNLNCLICSQKFETKDEILYHLKIHAGSRTVKSPNEKKFTCEYCDRRFFTRKDVRRHLVVHTGMRDFLCQFCPQRFGRKDHLVRHIKKSHSRNCPVENTEDSANRDIVIKFEIDEPKSPEDEVLHTFLGADSDPVSFLPQQSVEEVLGDLNIAGTAEPSFMVEDSVIGIPDILSLPNEESRENMPLPAFSKTFQSPPQQ